jgi:transcriptional regulator GlxA family with amidase domain
VVIVAFDGVEMLDVTGPSEVLSAATLLLERDGGPPGYELEVVAPSSGAVRTVSGIRLVADRALHEVAGPIDTLLVAGGLGFDQARSDPAVVEGVRDLAGRAGRVVSVCTGALLLAEAGVLDGRRATTHWAWCDELATYRGVLVEPEPIFVRDDHVWTSAGVTAGMDLALALVADDHGDALAHEVARWLVLFTRRPGGQSQFSVQLQVRAPTTPSLRELQGWIADHLAEDLSVSALAGRVGMAPRTFARTFAAEVGATPAAYVEAVRIEAAKQLLQMGTEKVAAVARRCGFGTVETMHRAFRRRTGTTPAMYRQHFRSIA